MWGLSQKKVWSLISCYFSPDTTHQIAFSRAGTSYIMPCILVICSLLTESVQHQTKHLEFGPPLCKEDLLWTGGSQVITLVNEVETYWPRRCTWQYRCLTPALWLHYYKFSQSCHLIVQAQTRDSDCDPNWGHFLLIWFNTSIWKSNVTSRTHFWKLKWSYSFLDYYLTVKLHAQPALFALLKHIVTRLSRLIFYNAWTADQSDTYYHGM